MPKYKRCKVCKKKIPIDNMVLNDNKLCNDDFQEMFERERKADYQYELEYAFKEDL